MKNTRILAALLTASVTSAALYAAPGMKADANGDKAVTKVEAMAAADARFARMDVNTDGKLDQADKAARIAMHFVSMDADKNGSLSKAEFVAAHEARAVKRADRQSARMDGEGSLHKGRRSGRQGGSMKMLARADTNNNKAVSQTEFRAMAEARFAKADANNDGTITAEERKGGRRDGWRKQRPAAPVAMPDAS